MRQPGRNAQIFYYLCNTIKKETEMKKVIYAIIIALALIVWLAWGGFGNEMGTLMVGLGTAFTINFVGDRLHEKETETE